MMKNLGKQIAINTILIVSLVYVVFAAVQTHHNLNHYLLSLFKGEAYSFNQSFWHRFIDYYIIAMVAFMAAIVHAFVKERIILNKKVDFICLLVTYWIYVYIYHYKLQLIFEYVNQSFISCSGIIINLLAVLLVPPVLCQIVTLENKNWNKYDLAKLTIGLIGLLFCSHLIWILFLIGLYLLIRHPRESLGRFYSFRLFLTLGLVSIFSVMPLSIMAIYVLVIWFLAFYKNMDYLKVSTIKPILSYMIIPAVLFIIIWLIEPYVFKWLGLPAYFSTARIPF